MFNSIESTIKSGLFDRDNFLCPGAYFYISPENRGEDNRQMAISSGKMWITSDTNSKKMEKPGPLITPFDITVPPQQLTKPRRRIKISKRKQLWCETDSRKIKRATPKSKKTFLSKNDNFMTLPRRRRNAISRRKREESTEVSSDNESAESVKGNFSMRIMRKYFSKFKMTYYWNRNRVCYLKRFVSLKNIVYKGLEQRIHNLLIDFFIINRNPKTGLGVCYTSKGLSAFGDNCATIYESKW